MTSITGGYFPSLRNLYANANNITTIFATDIGSLGSSTLDSLDLEDNSITDISGLSNSGTLLILDLSNNPISSTEPLVPLVNLVGVNLIGTGICDPDVAYLSQLTLSEEGYLNLNDNNITDVTGLGNVSGLRNLYLDNNVNLTTGVASLSTLLNPQVISLVGDTSISCADISTLEGAVGTGVVIEPASCVP